MCSPASAAMAEVKFSSAQCSEILKDLIIQHLLRQRQAWKLIFWSLLKKKQCLIFGEGRCKYFSPLQIQWDDLKNSPETSSPIQYTFTCITHSSYLLQHQGYLGEELNSESGHSAPVSQKSLQKASNSCLVYFTSFQADSLSHFSKHLNPGTWMEVLNRSWNNAVTVPPPHLRLSLFSLAAHSQWKSNSKIISAFWVLNNLLHLKVSNL